MERSKSGWVCKKYFPTCYPCIEGTITHAGNMGKVLTNMPVNALNPLQESSGTLLMCCQTFCKSKDPNNLGFPLYSEAQYSTAP